MFEKDLAKNAKKTWGVEVSTTKTIGNKIYSLISVGYKEYCRTDLAADKTEHVEIGIDKKGKKIYATYYFGTDY